MLRTSLPEFTVIYPAYLVLLGAGAGACPRCAVHARRPKMLRPSSARHKPVELRPLASSVGLYDDDHDAEHKSPTDKWLEYVLHKLHALLWVVLASAVAAYTNLFKLIIDGYPPSDPSRQLNG